MEIVGDLNITWWMWAMIAVVGILLSLCVILKLHELGIYPLREATKVIRRPWFETLLLLFCVGGLIQYGATKGTNGTENASQPRLTQRSGLQSGDSSDPGDGRGDTFAITNLCFTGIVPSSNSVYLSVAWPTNLFVEGTTLDFFAKISALTNEWTWLDAYPTVPNTTNLEVEIACPVLTSGSIVPSAMFFRVQDRTTCATTMRDTDSDGIPDVYELNNGTNPYVPDASLVHPLTVGQNGSYASVEAALADSAAYSVISLGEETFVRSKSLVLPNHPVLIEGPVSGYAVIQSDAEIGAIMLTGGQNAQTMFRNLIVDLRAQRNFQAGFWVGGNTPWTGSGAAATFENVHVRANYPGVEYFGWLFYRDEGGPSVLKRCVMNATGSTWAYGISSYDAASNVVEDCAFLNMPTNAGETAAIAILTRESTNGVIEVRYPEARPDLSWAGYSYSGTYSQTADADGDGLSDYDEVFLINTDPLLADSDGDGIPDGEEHAEGTNPQDVLSHAYRLSVSVINTITHDDMTNYVFMGSVSDWQSNLVFSCGGAGCETNITLRVLQGGLHMGAFRDLNRNGVFDDAFDVFRTNSVSIGYALSSLTFQFGDVDSDGVSDLQERLDETDPYRKNSLKILRTVRISNSDRSATITNYYAITQTPEIMGAQWERMSSDEILFSISQKTESGSLYVHAFRDFNGNGIYDQGEDAIHTKQFANGTTEVTLDIGDADADGEKDSQEFIDGTDPLDGKNFRLQAMLFFESIDAVGGLTNYVQVAANSDSWDNAPVLAFAGVASTNLSVLGIVTNGGFYAKYYRDVNKNGIFEADIDIYNAVRFGSSGNHQIDGVLLGDFDGDGVADSDELRFGTDPRNPREYRYNLDLKVSGIFATTNWLMGVVVKGAESLVAPFLATDNVYTVSITNVYTDCGEKVKVLFWEELNGNGVWDANELSVEQTVAVDGIDTVATFRLPLGAFDGDKDSMLDSWELQHGLDPKNATDAFDDVDGDGLIAMHEYLARCNPDSFDGTNTAVYSFCHSIDDRIRGSEHKSVAPYAGASTGSARNRNCWAYGIDVSSASPWNSTYGGTSTRAGTAISPRHIIFAKHYQIAKGAIVRFVGMDDVIYERTLVDSRYLVGTDIIIGVLSEDLPAAVAPAKILPDDFCLYIGDAKRLPMLMYDYSEHSIVTDSNALGYRANTSDGLVPVDSTRRSYFEEVVLGDSGDPKYLIYGNAAILTCALLTYGTGNSGSGPFVTFYRRRIQAVMDFLCPGYALQEFDFSDFRRLDDVR